MPAACMRPDHHLELLDGVLGDLGIAVRGLRGEEGQTCCSPSSFAVPSRSGAGRRDAVMHRQELDGRHAQVGQMLDRRFRRQPGIASPQFLRNMGIELGESLDVQLVDDRLVPGSARWAIVAPGEGGSITAASGAKAACRRSSNETSAAGSPNLYQTPRQPIPARGRSAWRTGRAPPCWD